MKRILCKSTAVLLLLALFLPLFSGCARETDDEMLAICERLLRESALVNEICFGVGLSHVEGKDEGYLTPGYAEATKASREKYGVNSTTDIKEKIRAVYSVDTCDYIDRVIFQPVREESTVASYRRYFDAEDLDGNLCLMVKKDYEPFATGSVTYENVRIAKHSRSRAEILVDITVSDGEESRTQKDVSFPLRYEDGWRLDALTYASVK